MQGHSNLPSPLLYLYSFSPESNFNFFDLQSRPPSLILTNLSSSQERLSSVPAHYSQSFMHFAKQGKRVIALAYKKLAPTSNYAALNRDDVESGLTFAGFVIFECPIKPDSAKAVKMLIESSHRVRPPSPSLPTSHLILRESYPSLYSYL